MTGQSSVSQSKFSTKQYAIKALYYAVAGGSLRQQSPKTVQQKLNLQHYLFHRLTDFIWKVIGYFFLRFDSLYGNPG